MQEIQNDLDHHDLNWILAHLGESSNPDWKDAMKEYGQMYGLDDSQRYPGYNAFRYLYPALYGRDANQLAFSNGLQDMSHESVNALLAHLTNPDQMANEYAAKTQATVGPTTTAILQRLKGQGAGIGTEAGAGLAVQNKSTEDINRFRASQDSSEGRSAKLNAILAAITGQRPDFADELNLHSGMVGTPRNQSGMQALAGTIGQFAGGVGYSKKEGWTF